MNGDMHGNSIGSNNSDGKKFPFDESNDKDHVTATKVVSRSPKQVSQMSPQTGTNIATKFNQKPSKIVQISQISWISKLLLLSSLLWSICYASAAVSFVFMHLFFNFTPVSCGNRSILTIFYAF